jgi:hypothetical protein
MFVLAILSFQTADAASSTNASNVDRFKNFLSSSPNVTNIVFTRRMTGGPRIPGFVINTNSIAVYQGIWQSNAYNLKSFESLNDLSFGTNASDIIGKDKENRWHLLAGHLRLHSNTDPQTTNAVEDIVSHGERILIQAIDFGVLCDKSSLVWTNDRFSAQVDGKQLQGEIIAKSDRGVETVRTTISPGGIGALIKYTYSKELNLPGLPNKFTVDMISRDGHLTPYMEFDIERLDVSSAPLQDYVFYSSNYTGSNTLKVIYTEKGLVQPDKKGNLRPVEEFKAQIHATPAQQKWIRIGLAFTVFLLTLIAVLIIKRSKVRG